MKRMGKTLILATGMILLFLLCSWFIPHNQHVMINTVDAKAKSTACQVMYAIGAYYVEYWRYPMEDAARDVTVDTDREIMDILLAAENTVGIERNPRRNAFFHDREADDMDDGRFRRGVTLGPDGGRKLWDPWGNFYRVRYDSNRDNQVEDPRNPGTLIKDRIIVWSAGKDGNFDTWQDNVTSW